MILLLRLRIRLLSFQQQQNRFGHPMEDGGWIPHSGSEILPWAAWPSRRLWLPCLTSLRHESDDPSPLTSKFHPRAGASTPRKTTLVCDKSWNHRAIYSCNDIRSFSWYLVRCFRLFRVWRNMTNSGFDRKRRKTEQGRLFIWKMT